MYQFRNDYSFGAHPMVLSALSATNLEGNEGYGFDPYSRRAAEKIRALCQAPEADVQFFIGGTSANFTAIAAFLRPWEGVLCADSAHINGHESGAVEATGHKLIQLPAGVDGKVTPAMVDAVLPGFSDVHLVKPRLLYISDTTETGGVYTKMELTALSRYCRAHKLLLFLDGARLGSALASPANDLTLADLAQLTDAFYIGGTKNGALMGEALVIITPSLQEEFFRIKKQRGGVLAKGWLLGVQFDALFTDDLYFEIARHANAMALRLQDGLSAMGYSFLFESPSNQLFPIVPNHLLPALDRLCGYEVWGSAPTPGHTIIRLVTSFGTRAQDVDGFLNNLAALPGHSV